MMNINLGTVGELMDYLATQPRDRRLVLAKDAEGNDFSPLANAEEQMYVPANDWSGETFPTPEDLTEWMAEPDSAWSLDDAAPAGAERVVTLGPLN